MFMKMKKAMNYTNHPTWLRVVTAEFRGTIFSQLEGLEKQTKYNLMQKVKKSYIHCNGDKNDGNAKLRSRKSGAKAG